MSLEDEVVKLRESMDRLAALLEHWEPRSVQMSVERPEPETPGPEEDAGGLLTTGQAARLLNVKKSWIYGQSSLGNIPMCKVGRFLRFEREELLAWARERARRLGPE